MDPNSLIWSGTLLKNDQKKKAQKDNNQFDADPYV